MPSRRQLLGVAGTGILAGLAGCSAVPAPRPKMDFAVDNARDEPVNLGVRFLRPHVAERSEAIVWSDHLEVPPRDDPDDLRHVEDVAPDRPYRIEVDEAGTVDHYHYRPDCADEDPYEVGVVANLRPGGGVSFTQTTCSADAPFL